MRSREHSQRFRPSWWPDDQPWPPTRSHGRKMRGRFFRRIGCLFGLVFFLFPAFLILLIVLIANALGIIQIPGQNVGWIVPLSVLVFIIVLGILFGFMRGLRRISIPFGNLIEASSRLAEGDYSTRVIEQGPAEVRTLGRAFNEMAARLQKHSEMRRNLMADLTHELRTPITVIQGSVEGMLDGVYALDPEHLKSIYEETQVLSRLVDDLRTLALAESGALELKKEPTDLGMLVLETVQSLHQQAETSQVGILTQVDDPAPTIQIDPLRFREVLTNLVTNSLRYTPPGGSIQVSVKSISQDGEARVEISVRDTGAGIKPEDLPHIFERFYKASDSGGMGLGLAIAKYIVEAHHGEIRAESRPGEGTLMRILIPA